MTGALLDVDPVVLLDFHPELGCEGIHHARGISGHDPEAPGAYLVTSPCCGPKAVQCAPRVAAMRFAGVLFCSICQKERLVETYEFIPVDTL